MDPYLQQSWKYPESINCDYFPPGWDLQRLRQATTQELWDLDPEVSRTSETRNQKHYCVYALQISVRQPTRKLTSHRKHQGIGSHIREHAQAVRQWHRCTSLLVC